tara:strand:+ start:305 stop:1219 length:915 start_codon:yes stop_codon:yes gene_type:complete
MSNEIIYSGITDLRLAEAMSAEMMLLLADRAALPNHAALIYAGDAAGSGSKTIKIPHAGLMGYDLMTSPGDGTAVANSALVDGSTTVDVALYSKSYEASDLAIVTGSGGILDPVSFAADAVVTAAATLTSLIADVTDGFTATVGTTTVNLTAAVFLEAIATLEVAKVPAPYMAILHPQQWADLRSDLATASGGAIQWNVTREEISVRSEAYKGNFLGVDVFVSSHVPTANAGDDRAGGMFGRGAIAFADSTMSADGADQMLVGSKVLFERSRTAKAGLTAYVSHSMIGVSMGIDACGVSIITDA